MEYKITVELIIPPKDEEKYESKISMYEQRIEGVDLGAIIIAANKIV